MIELIRSVETKKVKNGFQEKLKKDAEMIRSDEKMYVSADKTTFTSLIRPLEEKRHKRDNKKTDHQTVDKSNQKQKEIVSNLDLEDRVFATAKKDAYITIRTTPSAD